MSFAFKRFNFFQQVEVKGHAVPSNAVCAVQGLDTVWLGTDSGAVHALDSTFAARLAFSAHGHKVLDLIWLPHHQLLLSVGVEEPGVSSTTVKLWEAGKLLALSQGAIGQASSSSNVQPLALLKAFGPKQPEAEVICAAATESPSSGMITVALGLASGYVSILVGDITGPKPRLSHATRLNARPDQGDLWAVMGLLFAGQQGSGELLSLFVVTESQTLCFNLQASAKAVLDQQGVYAPRCCCGRGALLVVGRRDALCDFSADTRAGSVALEGEKLALGTLGRFMVVVVQEGGSSGGAGSNRDAGGTTAGTGSSSTGLGGLGSSLMGGLGGLHTLRGCCLQLVDVRCKVIAGSFPLPDTPRPLVFCAWGAVYALTGSGALLAHRELELGAQLEALFKRSLYKLALDVARSVGADAATLAGIHQRWGDHLYSKGEFDAAMQQYLETLPPLPPPTASAQRHRRTTSSSSGAPTSSVTGASLPHTLSSTALTPLMPAAPRLSAAGSSRLAGGGSGAKGGAGLGAGLGHSSTQPQEELFLEPSYVIRRFLDAQRTHSLALYLEQLHERGLATADHTTLLLNCYTKLKDVRKLDAFVHRNEAGAGADNGSGSGGGGELPFDAETAVRVLRGAGYAEHALWVARRAGGPSGRHWSLELLLDDLDDAPGAVAFLDQLPRQQRAEALKKYGKSLVNRAPEETTRLLMDLCVPQSAHPHASTSSSGGGHDGSAVGKSGEGATVMFTAAVTDFAHLFSDQPTPLLLLCEFVMASCGSLGVPPPGEAALYRLMLELYLAPSASSKSGTADGSSHGDGSRNASGAAGPGPSSTASQDAPTAAYTRRQHQQQQQHVQETSVEEVEAQARRAKALDLLASGWPPSAPQPRYDMHSALVLCRLAAFRPGLLLLYDRLKMPRETLQMHMEAKDYAGLINAALRYGDSARGGDPSLWSMVLDFMVAEARPPRGAADPGAAGSTTSAAAQEEEGAAYDHIAQVLDHIERAGVLPPLVVLQALARNPTLPLSLVKGYVARQLQRDSAAIARDRDAIAKLSSETEAMRKEAHKLRTQPHVFQNNRCAGSGAPLELPAAHFLCGHSFNLRQLGDSDRTCPLCAAEHRHVLEIRRTMQVSAAHQDRFFTELREAADGFSVVADHFGRGLMNASASSAAAAALPGSSSGGGGGADGLGSALSGFGSTVLV